MDAHGFVDICIKIYKNIYYIKNAPKNTPTPKAFEKSVVCFAPASRFSLSFLLPSNLGLGADETSCFTP